ncbi:hypothetical protein MB02_08290 [Croceicoccus estronivorus]|uniref:DUF924 family protein n=1 Tax=Croceicoccus estronivorus TaxID=1172626 RepID=UPI000836188E|nr:DUF924 family protein [Croceicoccus estronivorus]OCC23825.1 hypothetical protein MB02_08290 [Croceicoccus estronivorus]
MAAAPRRWAAELLHFWFHKLTPQDWFGGSERVDAQLRARFGPDLAALSAMRADSFLTDPLTARAAILLFDQVPRNIHRGTAHTFAFDPLARAICRSALLRGWDKGLSRQERQFLGMPLMHSEHITDQQWSMDYYTRLGSSFIRTFAKGHYDMVARFGRFPHRNDVLGRESTPAELAAVAAGHAW